MQIRLIWEFLETRMIRTPLRSKSKKAVYGLPDFKAGPWMAFFISRQFTLVVMLALGYRKGPDGKPEIDPDEAETVRLIYARYLEGRSLGDIQRELIEKDIPTAKGIQGWSRQVIQNILTNGRDKIALNQQSIYFEYLI